MDDERANSAEIQRRIDLVSRLVGQGTATSRVIEAMKAHCRINQRQAYRYLEKSRKQATDLLQDPTKQHAINALRREYLFGKLIETGDYASAQKNIDSTDKALRQRHKGGHLNESNPMAGSELDSLLAKFAAEAQTNPD